MIWIKGLKNGVVFFISMKLIIDTVDHEILQQKLRKYGIVGLEFEWLKSHLTGCKPNCTRTVSEKKTFFCPDVRVAPNMPKQGKSMILQNQTVQNQVKLQAGQKLKLKL